MSMYPIRINKFLAQSGVCSRREADRMIADGLVILNGMPAKVGDKILEKDIVKVEGKQIKLDEEKIYIAFHKPFGVITTTDPLADNNIISHIQIKKRIFPIGRLDVQSSGLILLTNDGEISNKISKAQNNHEKEYLVTVEKVITPEFLKKMSDGVFILDRKTLPARVQKISPNQFNIVLVQGLNKQIRRMCEALGYEVKILKRVRIMNIQLGELARGKWRYLDEVEQKALLKSLDVSVK